MQPVRVCQVTCPLRADLAEDSHWIVELFELHRGDPPHMVSSGQRCLPIATDQLVKSSFSLRGAARRSSERTLKVGLIGR